MNTAVNYLESLGAFELEDDSVDMFITLVSKETEKESKKAAVEFFLHIVNPKTEYVEKLIRSNVVRESIDLQHSVKRYTSDMEYKAAQSKSDSESTWFYLGGLIFSL